MSDYPEHDKLRDLGGANQIVGDFIEWLGDNGMWIAEYYNETELGPTRLSRDDMLAEHFGIDRKKLEAEKQAMLAKLRAA